MKSLPCGLKSQLWWNLMHHYTPLPIIRTSYGNNKQQTTSTSQNKIGSGAGHGL